MNSAQSSFLKCNPGCGHSKMEHKAFDHGLISGERGMFQCVLVDKKLRKAWLHGNSVGALNYYMGRKYAEKAFSQPITYMTDEFMARVFNLWLQRFQESPDEFEELTNVGDDYGARCVAYFNHLAKEVE